MNFTKFSSPCSGNVRGGIPCGGAVSFAYGGYKHFIAPSGRTRQGATRAHRNAVHNHETTAIFRIYLLELAPTVASRERVARDKNFSCDPKGVEKCCCSCC